MMNLKNKKVLIIGIVMMILLIYGNIVNTIIPVVISFNNEIYYINPLVLIALYIYYYFLFYGLLTLFQKRKIILYFASYLFIWTILIFSLVLVLLIILYLFAVPGYLLVKLSHNLADNNRDNPRSQRPVQVDISPEHVEVRKEVTCE
jgi:hypothetical protein